MQTSAVLVVEASELTVDKKLGEFNSRRRLPRLPPKTLLHSALRAKALGKNSEKTRTFFSLSKKYIKHSKHANI